jgi:hypothetical protein
VVLPAIANIGTTPVIVAVAVPTTIVIATTTVIRITAPVTAQPTVYHTIAPVFALYAVAAVVAAEKAEEAEKAEKVIPHQPLASVAGKTHVFATNVLFARE